MLQLYHPKLTEGNCRPLHPAPRTTRNGRVAALPAKPKTIISNLIGRMLVCGFPQSACPSTVKTALKLPNEQKVRQSFRCHSRASERNAAQPCACRGAHTKKDVGREQITDDIVTHKTMTMAVHTIRHDISCQPNFSIWHPCKRRPCSYASAGLCRCALFLPLEFGGEIECRKLNARSGNLINIVQLVQ